ncbi:MAG: hypothetical protein ACD_46C00103G0006 [uncultured bacterium]|nr:MAG: hypothetical protein ACD_46C00103G0006 [uncultured bacterium]
MKKANIQPFFIIRSSSHGLGVFAIKDIKKGHVLFKMTGLIKEAPTRTSVQVGKHKHIEDRLAGFVNHSCHPTARIAKRAKSLISLRDVHKGDEVTFNYNKNEDKLAAPFKCDCCNKTICGRRNRRRQ